MDNQRNVQAYPARDNTKSNHTGGRDNLNILVVQAGFRANKIIRAIKDGGTPQVDGFDCGYMYTALQPYPVGDIYSLSDALTALAGLPNMLLIRGQPEPRLDLGSPLRRLGGGDGSNFQGNFRTPPTGRLYVLIDFDKVPLPEGLELRPETVMDVVDYLVKLLPNEFHNVTYHGQLSSSAGIYGVKVVSAHVWFWLTKPVPDYELKRWGKFVNSGPLGNLIDSALFQHVQAHYTANPTFVGMEDPFPERSWLIEKEFDSVDIVLPPTKPTEATVATGGSSGLSHAQGGGFEHHISRIGDHPGGGGFHGPIRDAAASYVGTHGAEGTDPEALYQLLRDRTLAADRRHHHEQEVLDRASREHIEPIIKSALQKFGQTASERRKSRRIKGIEPHYPAPLTGEVDITTQLQNLIRGRG